MLDKAKNEAEAKEIFQAYSQKNTVHFTADGTRFFNESDAKNHAKTLKDSFIHSVDRSAVYPSNISEDLDDDENEGDDLITGDDDDDEERERIAAKYKKAFGVDADPEKSSDELEEEIAQKLKQDKFDAAEKKRLADEEKKAAAEEKAKLAAEKKAAADKEKADKKAADEKQKSEAENSNQSQA